MAIFFLVRKRPPSRASEYDENRISKPDVIPLDGEMRFLRKETNLYENDVLEGFIECSMPPSTFTPEASALTQSAYFKKKIVYASCVNFIL